MKHRVILAIGCCLAVGLLATGSVSAASIPAWLDDAISEWNDKSPDIQIEFVDIRDSYVWYMIPDTDEISHKDIREGVFNLAMANGYKITAEEELITKGKPPSPVTPYREKKCWTRSYVLDINELSNTTAVGQRGSGGGTGMRQRMLTSMVCEDQQYWFAGFRILQ